MPGTGLLSLGIRTGRTQLDPLPLWENHTEIMLVVCLFPKGAMMVPTPQGVKKMYSSLITRAKYRETLVVDLGSFAVTLHLPSRATSRAYALLLLLLVVANI